ncbi:cobalamin-dependent protein [bacterium]|nr:cobalamin-dependent protein [bacterium]
MKLLLINPPRDFSISSEVPEKVNSETNTIPPLGLMYLEAYLHAHSDHEVRIIDCLAERWHIEQLRGIIESEAPQAVGITGHTHDLLDMLQVTRLAKEISPDIVTIWGGPHASDFPVQCMGYPEVDICIPREGEIALCETMDALEKHSDLSALPGVYSRATDGTLQFGGVRPPIADLDILPPPRREILDIRKYSYVLGGEATSTTLMTSRGCPYKCTFCNTPGHNTWRWRSAGPVVDEIESIANLGINDIYIIDDTFNVRQQRTLDICQGIIDRKIKINWNFRARVNLITAEMVEACRKAGCNRVHVGVETGTDEGMAAINKALTTKQVRDGLRLLKKAKMTTVCYFMVGCPHEKTRADIMRTIDFALELDPDYALFGVLTPYPNTAVYDEGVRRGILDPNNWDNFLRNPSRDFHPQVWTEFFTAQELAQFSEMAFKRFYIRPKQMWRKLMELHSWKDFGRKLKAGWEIFKL